MDYDPDQPRDPQGRWTEGGGGGGAVPISTVRPGQIKPKLSPEEFKRLIAENKAKVEKSDANKVKVEAKGRAIATDLGFPSEKIFAAIGREEFIVDGRTYTKAGEASRYTGEVTLYSDVIGDPDKDEFQFKGLVAHEVQHQRFNTVYGRYQSEMHSIMLEPRTGYVAGGVDPVLRADGTLRPPYDEKYPVYNAWQEYYQSKVRELHEQDGVSEYSESYWGAVKAGEGDAHSAVHETLAEIARFDAQGIADRLVAVKERPAWVAFYDWINDTYDKLQGQDKTPNLLPKIEAARGIPYARMLQLEKAKAIYKETGKWPVVSSL